MTEIIERASIHYKNLSDKFTGQTTDYGQYCNIYIARLKQIEILLKKQINKKWGKRYPIYKLSKLAEKQCNECVVISMLFKEQKLKPSISKQLAEANQLFPSPISYHFTDESDQLFIEDESQRYHLLGTLEGKNLVTGIVCALLGRAIDKGRFMVIDNYNYVHGGKLEL